MQNLNNSKGNAESQNSNEGNEIDLLELFSVLLAKWLILCIFVLVGVALGLFAINYIRPAFHSDVLLQLDTQGNKSAMAMGDMGALMDVASPADAEIELIQSRMVLDSVVAKEHLAFNAVPVGLSRRLSHTEGRVDLGLLHIPVSLVEEKWFLRATSQNGYEVIAPNDLVALKGVVGDTYRKVFAGDSLTICVLSMYAAPGEKFRLYESDFGQASDGLKSKISVAEKGKKTSIIQIEIENRYADKAASILNSIAEAYVRQNVEMRSEEAAKTLEFLEKQIPLVKAKLDSSESALTAYRHREGTVDLTGEARSMLDKRVTLESQRLELAQKRQEAARLFKEDHPNVVALRDQEEQIQQEIDRVNTSAKGLPFTQQEVLRLQEDVDVNNSIYTTMLNNMQQLRVMQAGEIGNVRIVDRARIEVKPVKPKKAIIFAGFILGSFLLGSAFILLLRSLKSSGVRSSSEIERETGVSVYAKIPETKIKCDTAFSLVEVDPEDLACEALRTLRTALEFSFLEESKGKVLLITGLTAGIGKSFVSKNLAALFAHREKKVLLIDADLRRGELSTRGRHKGLTDYFLGHIPLDEAIEHIDGANIDLIGTGRGVPSPSEMIASASFGNLISTVRTKYDLVIIDTPPILFVTDAQIACRYSDFALLLVRYAVHDMESVKEGLALLDQVNMTNRAIVLNRCVYEGGHGSYGYGYKYKYGYKKS